MIEQALERKVTMEKEEAKERAFQAMQTRLLAREQE